MQGRIGLLSTDNNSGSLKGGQPACVCQDAFRSTAIRASCCEQRRPAIKKYWTRETWPAPSLCSDLVYHSQQVFPNNTSGP